VTAYQEASETPSMRTPPPGVLERADKVSRQALGETTLGSLQLDAGGLCAELAKSTQQLRDGGLVHDFLTCQQ
jgi:hypothetical protein